MRAFLLILICELLSLTCVSSQDSSSPVQKETMKVHISATGDTITLKFLRPHPDAKLEGYILGYGSSMFSKQFIRLPENKEPYEAVIDAEPKYLIAVQPVKANEVKKQCTGKVPLEKPLHLVIGSVTPTSVLLSWGTLLKTPYTDTNLEDCFEEGQFTVRYREKEPSKNWNYQMCPTTDTVIDNLKPDTPYEFGVRANIDSINGEWSPPVVFNTADTDVQKPLPPLIQPRPQAPVFKAPRTFLPPVPAVHNISQSRPTPLLRHTALPRGPRRNFGTDHGGIATSSPSVDPLSFIQAFTYTTYTPATLPPPKTTLKPQYSKILPTTNQQLHTTQSHLSPTATTKVQPSTTKNLPTTTVNLPITTETQASITGAVTHTIVQPRTTPPQTTIFHTKPTTVQYHDVTTQSKPTVFQNPEASKATTQQELPHTTQSQLLSTQPQPSTTKFQSITTQSQPTTTKLQTFTTQPEPSTTQTQAITSQQKPSRAQIQSQTTQSISISLQPRTHQQPSISQTNKPNLTRPNFSTTQLLTSTIQQQMTTKLNFITDVDQPLTINKHPNKMQQLSTSPPLQINMQQPTLPHERPGTTYRPTFATCEFETDHQHSTVQDEKSQPPSESTSKGPSTTVTLLTIPTPTISTQENMPSQHPTSQQPANEAAATASPIKSSDPHPPSTTNTVTKTITVTKPQHQPTLAQDHYTTSSTTQFSHTTKWRYGKTESPPHITNNIQSTTDHVLHVPKKPYKSNKKPSTKSKVNQNSPWAEKQAVVKELPGRKTAPSNTKDGQSLPGSALVKEVPNRSQGRGLLRNSSSTPSVTRPLTSVAMQNGTVRERVPPASFPGTQRLPSAFRNASRNKAQAPSGEKHKGLLLPKPSNRKANGPHANLRFPQPTKKKPNQLENQVVNDKVTDLKQMDPLPVVKPQPVPNKEKSVYQNLTTPTPTPLAFNGSHFETSDNSSVFSSFPTSEVDAAGKKRFVAPHVMYKTGKPLQEPCSVTHSLSFFPDEEVGEINVTGPPKNPISNLTVVAVEGCPSFVILDWEKSDNETTEYEVTSSKKGPDGNEVSTVTTNQTHTAVENLTPESSYEFTVTPKNELGSGPASDPVTFSTESADPRVSEISTGKTAIWSSFSFKSDSYSECNGRQFVKRTWYRKFVGIQLCNSLRYKIYLSDSLKGKFYNIGDQTGFGEDHCQFVDSFLDGRTGGPLSPNELPPREGYFRAVRQEPVKFGEIGGSSHINYVAWYECGIPIPGSW